MTINVKNSKTLLYFIVLFYIMLTNILILFDIENVIFKQEIRNIAIYIIFIWLLYEVIVKILRNKIKIMHLYIIVYMLYISSIYLLINRPINILGGLLNVLFFPTVFMLSNMLSENSNIDKKYKSIACIFIVTISFFYINIGGYHIYSRSALTINSVYYIVMTIPFILKIRNRYIKSIVLLISLIAILYSLKRTVILAIGFALIIYYFIESKLKGRSIKNKFKFLVSSVGFIGIISIIYNYLSKEMGLDVLAKFISLFDDGGSGRIEIFFNVAKIISESNFINILFGHGYDGVNFMIGISAHNDFLEILFDYGLIGLMIYMLIIIKLVKYLRAMINEGSNLAPSFAVSLTIFLVSSMSSHLAFVPTYFAILATFWGISISEFEKEKYTKIVLKGGDLK